MNENRLSYNFGVLQGRLEALKAYCETEPYIHKETVLAIAGLEIDEMPDESTF